MPDVNAALRSEVRARAKRRSVSQPMGHEVDQIVAIKHGGEATAGNLALCWLPIDPETGEMQRLFNPRRDQWREHFELRGAEIVAHTAVGRVTVRLLQLNRTERLREREIMIHAGLLSL